MRLLLVEDDEGAARALISHLLERDLDIDVTHAKSRDSAFEALADDIFDFLVCGIELPSSDGGSDLSVDHGFEVYDRAFELSPGTPVLFLTGKGDQPAAREKVAGRGPEDALGRGDPYPMAQLVYKHESPVEIELIEAFAREFALLEAIPVSQDGDDSARALSPHELRVLRIFARRHEAGSATASTMGGHSQTRTVRAQFRERDGDRDLTTVVVKLGPLQQLREEEERYQEAAVRLPAGAYAPLIDRVVAGAGKIGGLFFSLAGRHPRTLWQVMREDPELATATVVELRAVLESWKDAKADIDEVLVAELRQERIGHAALGPHTSQLAGSGWREFEAMRVRVGRSLQHGDLHGGNVLVGERGMPLLIDFADVRRAPSCFDPIALELSLLFQAESPIGGSEWPSLEQARLWADVDAYAAGSPAEEFVRECRRWASEAAVDELAVCAVAYCEAVRQLGFERAPQDLAVAVAGSAARRGLELAKAQSTAADRGTTEGEAHGTP